MNQSTIPIQKMEQRAIKTKEQYRKDEAAKRSDINEAKRFK